MSKEIEQRVVQMTFDNDGFEKNANTTIDTLHKLEQALQIDKSAEGLVKLQNVADNFSMRGVITSIETTAKKYSWLEQIAIGAYRSIGEKATQYLTNQVLDLTSVNQAVSGWKKYENEIEAVQSIISATGKSMSYVEKYLDKLSWYTSETSYEYQAMVTNIAKFNAAGITDLNTATNAMIGIANMAGYFGVSASKATHAMEGFAKAIGKGKMDSASWQWIETAGMNALSIQQAFIDSAVQLNKIKKVGKDLYKTAKGTKFQASEFKTVLKEGWLDQEVMLATFKKYGVAVDDVYKKWQQTGGVVSEIIDEMYDDLDPLSAAAFRYSQQAKTFTDVLGSLQTVVADGWRLSFRYIFGNYEEAKVLWTNVVNSLWDIFASSGDKRNTLLQGWYEGGGRDALFEGVANAFNGILNIINPIKEAFDKVFPGPTVKQLITFSEKFRDITAKFRSWFEITDPKDNPLFENMKETTEVTETFDEACQRTYKDLDKLYDKINRGELGHEWERWKKLGKDGYVWQIVQNYVNERYTKAGVGNYPKRYAIVDDGITQLRKKQIEVEKEDNILTAEQLMANRRAQKLQRTFEGLFSVISLVKDVFTETVSAAGGFFIMLGKKLAPSFNLILDALSKVGVTLTNLRNRWSKNKIADSLYVIVDALSTVVATIINNIVPIAMKAMGWFSNLVGFIYQNAVPALGAAYTAVSDVVSNLWNAIASGSGFNKLKKSLETIWGYIKIIVGGAYEVLSQFGGKVFTGVEKLVRTISGATEELSIGEVIAWVFDTVAGKIADFIDFVVEAKDNVIEFFKVFSGKDAEKVESLAEMMSSVTANLSEVTGETLSPFKKTLEDIYQFLVDMFTKLQSPISFLTGVISTALTSIVDLFDNLTIEKLAQTLKDTGIGVFFGVLAKNIAEGTVSISTIPTNFNLVLKGIYDTLELYQRNLNGKALKTAAEGVLILAAAMIAISAAEIDTQKVSDFAVSASLIMFAAGAFLTGLSKLKALGKKVTEVKVLENVKFSANLQMIVEKFMNPINNFMDSLAKSINKKLNGGQLAKAFLYVSGAIGIIVYIIKMIHDNQEIFGDLGLWYNDDKGDFHLTQLGRIVSFITAIGVVMAILVALGGGHQTFGAALPFITSVLALKMIIDTIKDVLTNWKPEELENSWRVLVVVAGILVTLATAIALSSRTIEQTNIKGKDYSRKSSSKSGGSPIGVALAVIMFAFAINLMMPAIKTMAGLSEAGFSNVIGILITFGVFIAAMAGIAKGLAGTDAKALKSGVKAVKSIANMLVVMMVAMGAVAALLGSGALGDNGNDIVSNFTSAIMAMFIATTALVGIAYLLAKSNIADSMEKVGKAMALFGVGILAFSAGAYVIGYAADAIIQGFVKIGQALQDQKVRGALMEGVAAVFLVVAGAIVLAKSGLLEALYTVIKGCGLFILEKGTYIFGMIVNALVYVVELLTSHKAIIILLLVSFIGVFFDLLDGLLPTLVNELMEFLTKTLLILAKAVSTRGGQLALAALDLAGAIVNLFLKAIGTFFANVEHNIFEGWGLPDEVFNSFGNWLLQQAGEFDEALAKDLENVTASFEELNRLETEYNKLDPTNGTRRNRHAEKTYYFNKDKEKEEQVEKPSQQTQKQETENPLNALTSYASGAFGDIANYIDIGSITDGLTEGKIPISNAAQEMLSGLPDEMLSAMGGMNLNLTDGLGGIVGNIFGSKDTVSQATEEVADAAAEKTDVKEEVGENVENAYYHTFDIMENKEPEVEQAAETHILTPILEVVGEVEKEMYKRGEWAVDGFVSGVKSEASMKKIWSAGSGVTAKFLGSYDITSETSSPAKTMIWRGLMAITGFVKGVFDNLYQVEDAGMTVANALVGTVTDALYYSDNITPTITPVVDMTAFNSGLDYVDSAFGSRYIDANLTPEASRLLASDVFTGFDQNMVAKQVFNESLINNNSDVVSQLEQLRSDVTVLNDSFLNTQVVLDSGALVGATARKMDNALGRRNIYKGRGI